MEENKPIIHLNKNDSPDSLEIGTPAKGGAIKVYGNFNDLDDFKAKIDNAVEARKYAQTKLEYGN